MRPTLGTVLFGAGIVLSSASDAAVPAATTFLYSGTITTVSRVNGAVTTTTVPLDVPLYYSKEGVMLPTSASGSIQATGYINNEPPRPPPPADLPAGVSSVTLKVDNGQMTRTTTYTRPVTSNPSSPEGVDDGPWTVASDSSTTDAGAGGGGCNQKTDGGRDCPLLN